MNVNTDIAVTYLLSRKRQTLVAALGVTFGISMYIFLQSLMTGTNDYFEKESFNTIPHIRIYSDYHEADHAMLDRFFHDSSWKVIVNPKLIAHSVGIQNPYGIIRQLAQDPDVVAITPQVASNVFFNNGNIQVNGTVRGVDIMAEDRMFDVRGNLKEGRIEDLPSTANGLIIGNGIAEKLSLSLGDNLTIIAPNGQLKLMKVVGITESAVATLDNSLAYANTSVVQQLLRKDPTYVTDIKINLKEYHQAPSKAPYFEALTGYRAEDWLSANAQLQAAFKVRAVILNSVIAVILIVAGFGIYNILNMTIYEKIKEIAILKANGFSGKAVTSVFLQQALIIGFVGGVAGLLVGLLISYGVSRIRIGMGGLEYLPLSFEPRHYFQGILFGVITTFFAGWFPARKASRVDPVKIIRG